MKYLFLILTSLSSIAYGQQSEKWIEELENDQSIEYRLKSSDQIAKYSTHDFSELLKPKSDFLGFIGTNYKRIFINFKQIQKSTDSSNVYNLSGSSTVGTNTCDFLGTIKIKKIKEVINLHLGIDNIYADSGIVSQGIIIAEYELNESKDQKYSGTFKGIMTLWFYVNKDGNIQYDDIEKHSASFNNNQFIGTWQQYNSTKTKICNWGEYRIPYSGNLDIGASEFSVNPKYYPYGWGEFNTN